MYLGEISFGRLTADAFVRFDPFQKMQLSKYRNVSRDWNRLSLPSSHCSFSTTWVFENQQVPLSIALWCVISHVLPCVSRITQGTNEDPDETERDLKVKGDLIQREFGWKSFSRLRCRKKKPYLNTDITIVRKVQNFLLFIQIVFRIFH